MSGDHGQGAYFSFVLKGLAQTVRQVGHGGKIGHALVVDPAKQLDRTEFFFALRLAPSHQTIEIEIQQIGFHGAAGRAVFSG
jgi:hypothetical protein